MSETRPTIPAGDIARKFKLPRWLRWLLDLFRGVKFHAGPVDIQLAKKPGASTGPEAGPPR